MRLSDFDYQLPDELIAQEATPERDTSRLLRVDRNTGARSHHRFTELPELLAPGDLLVINDTRVVPARLLGRRDPSGGAVECLLLARLDGDRWDALVHPGQKLRPGTRARFEGNGQLLEVEVLERHFHGRRTIRLTAATGTVDEAIYAIGHVPLPPYIKRPDRAVDRERYQTVYAAARGSVAAPTAGLHFTLALLDRLADRGVERCGVTLHVGYGTFEPVRTEVVEEHRVAPERYCVPPATPEAINRARSDGRRVIAVGTTTTRTLEAAARLDYPLRPTEGETDLTITGDFDFRVVDGLLTNFHLPRSSLLLLVAAFAGRERILAAYREAVGKCYRFYSYGDAMLIL